MRIQAYMLSGLLFGSGGNAVPAGEAGGKGTVIQLTVADYVAPQYPRSALNDGLCEGTAVVAFCHDAAGRVTDALAVESSQAAFAREAVDAVQQWRVATHGEDAIECQRAHVIKFTFRAGGIVYLPSTPTRSGTQSQRAQNSTYNLVTFDDLPSRPQLLSQPVASLLANLKAKTGQVRIVFFVDEAGRVRVPSVLSAPDPALAAAVLQSLANWRYEPPRRNGRPLIALEQLDFNFSPTADASTVVSLR